jgi:hypothetical protein
MISCRSSQLRGVVWPVGTRCTAGLAVSGATAGCSSSGPHHTSSTGRRTVPLAALIGRHFGRPRAHGRSKAERRRQPAAVAVIGYVIGVNSILNMKVFLLAAAGSGNLANERSLDLEGRLYFRVNTCDMRRS